MLDGKVELQELRNKVTKEAEYETETDQNEISGKPRRFKKISTKGKPIKKGLAAMKEIMNLPGVNMSPRAKRAYAKMQERELRKQQALKKQQKETE